MADEAVKEETAAGAKPPTSPGAEKKQKQRKGILSRVWNGVFRGKEEDYEKRLKYLSMEEAAVHSRMKRRAQGWRETARNVVVCSVFLEVAAMVYAISTTRSLDLNWQMRAVRVLPMFLFPGLSYLIYSTLASFTKMRDRKDHKTLEWLRAERRAKIDELKERTHYYTTQQLIQRYDVDPAAKAAAATVLASKLGADSGLELFLGDESKVKDPSEESDGIDLVPTVGLRHRKHSSARSQNTGSSTEDRYVSETSDGSGVDADEVSPVQTQGAGHYKSSGTYDGGWIPRVAAMLVGEDPTQCYALICRNCHMHNGLARKEDFPYVTYYCPHCHALNASQHLQERDPVSGNGSPQTPGGTSVAWTISNSSSVAAEAELFSNSITVGEHFGRGGDDNSTKLESTGEQPHMEFNKND